VLSLFSRRSSPPSAPPPRRADTAMFWSLGHFSSPSIDTILDREDGFTLEDLLEEDELLQECKAQNAKLTEL
jgi:hypothetical protein